MKNLIKKMITLILTLFVVSVLTFIAFQVLPGDSAIASFGTDASPEQVEALREQMGYNDPIIVQYGNWLKGAVTGDLGQSISYHQPVSTLIGERLPVTLTLAILSLLMILVISLPLGIVTSRKQKSRMEGVWLFFTQLGMAIPPFFLGILITMGLGITLQWFTPGAFVSWNEDKAGFLYYLIFPAIAVAVPKIAMMTKFLRSSIKRQISMDYVRTAKSKGNTTRGIMYNHVLKNALIPVITFLAMIIAEIFAGSIIVEQVFNLPGLGRLLVAAISTRDFPVVQAIVLYIAALVLILNFIVDVLYQVIDPRVGEA